MRELRQLRKRIVYFLESWDKTDELTEPKKALFLGDAVELLREILDLLVKLS